MRLNLFKRKSSTEENIGQRANTEPVLKDGKLPRKGARYNPKLVYLMIGVIVSVMAYVLYTGLTIPDMKTSQEKNEERFQQNRATLANAGNNDGLTEGLPQGYGDNKTTVTGGAKKQQPTKPVDRPTIAAQNRPVNLQGVYTRTPVRPMVSEAEKERLAGVKSSIRFNMASGQKDGGFQPVANRQENNQAQAGSQDSLSGNHQENFLKTHQRASDSIYLKSRVQPAYSEYEIKAGSIIPGVVVTGIDSSVPGQIVGQVRENVYDTVTGNHLLIPIGTKVIGKYDSNIDYAQDRLLVVWNRLIFPNGSSIDLEGMTGTDREGYAGFKDKTNYHTPRLINGVLLGSVMAAGARVATGGTNNDNFGNLVGQGIAENIMQATAQITEKNLNVKPTLEIRTGYQFNIFVGKDMILEPYRD